MPKIKHKHIPNLERNIDWRKWTASREFHGDKRNDWIIIDYGEPVRLYKKDNIQAEFKHQGIFDRRAAENLVRRKPNIYRFDLVDPISLKIKTATHNPAIKPIKINFNWYKKLAHDNKVIVIIMILTLIVSIVFSIIYLV